MEDTMAIYTAFKQRFFLSAEIYDPKPDNVRRWKYHLCQVDHWKEMCQPVTWDLGPLEAIMQQRRVTRFVDMPRKTREIYMQVAACFPGQQVFACGSRVRGDYVDPEDPEEIMEARRLAGKRVKYSDWDYWVPGIFPPVGVLPEHTEQVKAVVPAGEKIAIPMFNWDFTKLPEHEHPRVVELLKSNRLGELVLLHDRYQLSSNVYCCDLGAAQAWFQWGVTNGLIKDGANENGSTTGTV